MTKACDEKKKKKKQDSKGRLRCVLTLLLQRLAKLPVGCYGHLLDTTVPETVWIWMVGPVPLSDSDFLSYEKAKEQNQFREMRQTVASVCAIARRKRGTVNRSTGEAMASARLLLEIRHGY
ncbi:uncharacterized protein DFL_001035 [Arthrobotrys flagrans]|uniref:Uncharacterized protein n=1 Tax=Arthrobotrys flagrans TaxID=97331 RepID=A0A437AFZ3_ARTFL|nr:hypothetical protein DFL_001035 [Arthrobotrys flagrans]